VVQSPNELKLYDARRNMLKPLASTYVTTYTSAILEGRLLDLSASPYISDFGLTDVT
jgi:hypothetical protein